MMTRDLHMHTSYCDGANTPEEMVRAAVDRGLHTVGLCGHSYTAFDTSYCMQRAGVQRFLGEVRYLRAEYFDRIHVLCGVEQDYYSDEPTDDFDYVIGSVHYLMLGEEYVPVDETPDILRKATERYFGGDIYALCEAYFNTAADVVNKTACDIIGHFDLIAKFNEQERLFDEHDPRYVAAWQQAADALLRYDIPFEINTGAVSRGYRSTPYPSADMIAYIKEHGGKFILSSDAHDADHIAYGFESFENLIQ